MQKSLRELIGGIIEEEARVHMVKFYKKHKEKEWAWFFENLYDVAERDLRERIAENKADVHAKCDFSLMGKGMAEVKYSYEILQELIDTLRNEQGHALYSEDWINPQYENKYITGIKKRISNTDWKLELCKTYGNVWNWEKGKRMYKEHDVARLIDSKGTELIFDLPDDLNPKDDPETIHVLMYSQKPENQLGFYHMKKTFYDAVKIISFDAGYRGVMSPCLHNTNSSPEVKIKKGKQKDWRVIKSGEDEWKLLKMWITLGFIRPKIPNRNPDEIYLFSPKYAFEIKEAYVSQGYPNPYKNLKRCSIYEDDIREELIR